MSNSRRRRMRIAALSASGVALSLAASTLYAPAQGLDLDLGLGPINLRLGGQAALDVTEIGRLQGASAEIVAYDRRNDRAWLTSAPNNSVQIVDLADPVHPVVVKSIDMALWGATVTSVAISGRHAVVGTRPANPADDQDLTGSSAVGKAVLFDLAGNATDVADTGFGPDAVTFAPDGNSVLIANEGEPQNYTGGPDPEGSVSVLGVEQGRFRMNKLLTFAGVSTLSEGVRKGAASIAQDLEPEYVSVTGDSRTAFVTLQENNAVAEFDLIRRRLVAIRPAGYVDHAQVALDPSDKNGISIRTFPGLLGMRMPDAVSTFRHLGRTYYVTANEGDVREYDGLPGGADDVRVSAFAGGLPTAWLTAGPGGTDLTSLLTGPGQLGRLAVTELAPSTPGGPLYSYGTRSFTVFDERGRVVFDSGSDFERITAATVPGHFNASLANPADADQRSDAKGPEPEGVAVGTAFGRTLAVITLERTGGIMAYDVTDPARARFVDYVPGDTGNPGPEGVQIVEQRGQVLILVASEGDDGEQGALTVYRVRRG